MTRYYFPDLSRPPYAPGLSSSIGGRVGCMALPLRCAPFESVTPSRRAEPVIGRRFAPTRWRDDLPPPGEGEDAYVSN